MPHRIIVRRIGLRGEALLGLGVVWMLLGIGVGEGLHRPPADASLWHLLLPDQLRAGIWIVSGLLAVVASMWQRLSPLALALLVVAPMIRITSYGWAWLMALIPGPPPGHPTAWYVLATQTMLLASVLFAAHVPVAASEDQAEELLRDRLRGL